MYVLTNLTVPSPGKFVSTLELELCESDMRLLVRRVSSGRCVCGREWVIERNQTVREEMAMYLLSGDLVDRSGQNAGAPTSCERAKILG